jgi:hypothetical protein
MGGSKQRSNGRKGRDRRVVVQAAQPPSLDRAAAAALLRILLRAASRDVVAIGTLDDADRPVQS